MDIGVYDEYGGTVDLDTMDACWEELSAFVAALRGRLGKADVLLNQYLHAMLETLCEVGAAIDCESMGFESGMSELFRIIRNLRSPKDEDILQTSFYSEAKECDMQLQYEHNSAYRYKMAVALFHRYSRHALTKYREACENYLEDARKKTRWRDCRNALAELIDDESVARLDELLLRHQLSLSPMRIYLQGLLDSLVTTMLSAYEMTGEVPI